MSDYLGRFFARLMPILLILVIVVVIGRYFFDIGRVDIQELALYVHALIFLGCAGWAYSADEHVRVDIFYRNASPVYKKLINFNDIQSNLFELIKSKEFIKYKKISPQKLKDILDLNNYVRLKVKEKVYKS